MSLHASSFHSLCTRLNRHNNFFVIAVVVSELLLTKFTANCSLFAWLSRVQYNASLVFVYFKHYVDNKRT